MMKIPNRINIAITLVAMFIGAESSAAEYAKGANHFATFLSFRNSTNTGCSVSDVVDLSVGQPVTVVILTSPQRLVKGLIAAKSTSPCAELAKSYFEGTFYEIALPNAEIEMGDLGVLIDNDAVSSRQTKDGRLVVTANGTGYQFDECASHEGIHLSVHSLDNSQEKLVWHDYMYLEYGTEPTCDEYKYETIDFLNKSFNLDAGRVR
jgi:hypothetical protein